MEIKVEHITTVTLFEKTFELTNNEFKDFLTACRTLLEREGSITDKPMIKITKEGLETFKPGVWTEPGVMLLQSPSLTAREHQKFIRDCIIEGIEKEAPEINSTPIEAAETIKPMDEVVHSKMETTTQPMDTKVLTDRIDKMRPYTSRKDIDPYVAMHEAGRPMEAIKNQMLKDDFCAQGSLPYFAAKILKASTRVTKIELESVAETADETIERLKRENAEGKEKRKQPKMAVK